MPSSRTTSVELDLIAPCGINCRLCRAYVRERNACPGCRGDDSAKAKTCVTCKIKNCEKLAAGNLSFCYACSDFPCERVAHLDKRYRTKYATSPIENLESIQRIGLAAFVRQQDRKWACPRCGSMLCMHKPECLSCGYVWHN